MRSLTAAACDRRGKVVERPRCPALGIGEVGLESARRVELERIDKLNAMAVRRQPMVAHPADPQAGFELFHDDCRFTDDTVCTLAITEALMTGQDFAPTLRAFVRRYPQAGYGEMFRRWAFAEDAPAYGSWGNGAPMRVAAVGWWTTTEAEALELAAAQAAVSHDHPDAVAAAQAVALALAILWLRHGEAPATVRDRLSARFSYDLRPESALRQGGVDVSAAGTVPPALTAAFDVTDWEDAVRSAVCLGGDTDTLACITGAVADAIHGPPRPDRPDGPQPAHRRAARGARPFRARRRGEAIVPFTRPTPCPPFVQPLHGAPTEYPTTEAAHTAIMGCRAAQRRLL